MVLTRPALSSLCLLTLLMGCDAVVPTDFVEGNEYTSLPDLLMPRDFPPRSGTETGNFPLRIDQATAVDVNGDGYDDLVTVHRLGNSASGERLYRVGINQGAQSQANPNFEWRSYTHPVGVMTLTTSGTRELVQFDQERGLVLREDQVSINAACIKRQGDVALTVIPADLNADGRDDLICVDGQELFVMLGRESSFDTTHKHPASRLLLIGDVDGDKDLDALISQNDLDAETPTERVVLAENNGQASFSYRELGAEFPVATDPKALAASLLSQGEDTPPLIVLTQGVLPVQSTVYVRRTSGDYRAHDLDVHLSYIEAAATSVTSVRIHGANSPASLAFVGLDLDLRALGPQLRLVTPKPTEDDGGLTEPSQRPHSNTFLGVPGSQACNSDVVGPVGCLAAPANGGFLLVAGRFSGPDLPQALLVVEQSSLFYTLYDLSCEATNSCRGPGS